MFFIFSEFRLISEAFSGQNRIPRAVFMLGDGLELNRGAQRMDLYINEQSSKKYASYLDPTVYPTILNILLFDMKLGPTKAKKDKEERKIIIKACDRSNFTHS